MCGGGPSQSEITAQQQSAAESSALFQDFSQQFSESQGFLNDFLRPQLESLYKNPSGFGAQAMADLTANLVNTTGQQAANAKQQANAQFSSQNMAGLPSGVQQAIQSEINAGAGNTVAQGQTNINLANEQYKAQQRTQALSGLESIPGMLNAAPQTGGLLTSANQNSFNQADKINQETQAGDFWGNLGEGLLGGVIGGGLDFLTGGLGSLAGGGSFLSGGAKALGFTGSGGGGGGGSSSSSSSGGQASGGIA